MRLTLVGAPPLVRHSPDGFSASSAIADISAAVPKDRAGRGRVPTDEAHGYGETGHSEASFYRGRIGRRPPFVLRRTLRSILREQSSLARWVGDCLALRHSAETSVVAAICAAPRGGCAYRNIGNHRHIRFRAVRHCGAVVRDVRKSKKQAQIQTLLNVLGLRLQSTRLVRLCYAPESL